MMLSLDEIVTRLTPLSDSPNLDAQVLLAHVLEKPRTWVLAHPEVFLSRNLSSTLDSLIQRLERGERLPYVLGKWEFFGLEFNITPQVLIPRPETELLVERALSWLRSRPVLSPSGASRKSKTIVPEVQRVMDVGTGSGCIAISLAVNVSDLHVLATDISPAAIDVAHRNAEKFGVDGRVEYFCCDLFPPDDRKEAMVSGQSSVVDLITANLPYIPTEILHGLPIYSREPSLALDGGLDGLDIIRRLLAGAPHFLASDGMLLLEIEASNGQKVLSQASDAFTGAEICLHQDLSGRDRLVEIQT